MIIEMVMITFCPPGAKIEIGTLEINTVNTRHSMHEIEGHSTSVSFKKISLVENSWVLAEFQLHSVAFFYDGSEMCI